MEGNYQKKPKTKQPCALSVLCHKQKANAFSLA